MSENEYTNELVLMQGMSLNFELPNETKIHGKFTRYDDKKDMVYIVAHNMYGIDSHKECGVALRFLKIDGAIGTPKALPLAQLPTKVNIKYISIK